MGFDDDSGRGLWDDVKASNDEWLALTSRKAKIWPTVVFLWA